MEVLYNNLQFIILIELLLFMFFMWLGYAIPQMEGKKVKFHSMPFSGGLFIIFGGFSFISMSIHLNSFANGYLSGMLITIGIVILIYGVFKGFFYGKD